MDQFKFATLPPKKIAAGLLMLTSLFLATSAVAKDCNAICDAKTIPCNEAINRQPSEWRQKHAREEGQKCLNQSYECFKKCIEEK